MQLSAPEYVLILKLVVLDAELNSASNGDISNGGGSSGKKGVWTEILGFFTLFF